MEDKIMSLHEYRFNQGIEKGFENGVISVAKNMVQDGCDLKQISKCCPTLSKEELLSIQQEVIKTK